MAVNDFTANLGNDLDAFKTHAKRTVVSVQDVMLTVRKNKDLHALLSTKIASINSKSKKKM